MLVRELMQRHLVSVADDATLTEAVSELMQTQLSALPVLDRFGRAVGVLSARDILAAVSHQTLDETLVLEVMQAWPPTVSADADVQVATDRMLELRAQRLFVEEGGALVGVISLTDIARAFALAAA